MGVKLTGMEEALARYERLKKAVKNMKPHLLKASPAIVGIIKTHYGDNDLKVDTNRLRGSIQKHIRANRKSITYGSNVAYAAIHQFGGTIIPKSPGGWLTFKTSGGWANVKSVDIPARPWLNFPDSEKPVVARILAGSIEEAVQ